MGNGEMIVIIDKNRAIKEGYTGFYFICNNCQTLILKPLEVIASNIKNIQNYEERKEEFSKTRNWCRKCWQEITHGERWTMIFIDSNGYVKNTSYVHGECCHEILYKLGIMPPKDHKQKCLI